MMKSVKILKNLKNKRALVRVDFNFTLRNGLPLDSFRLKASLPTLKLLAQKKAKVILISHLGKPEKERGKKKLSFKNLISWLARQDKILKSLQFIENPFSERAVSQIHQAKSGSFFLLENIRFWPEEKQNNFAFSKKLSKLGDIYVNEAFSVCHRKHSSIVGLPKFLPSYAGIRLQEEITTLRNVLEKPKHPFVLISGGAKISTKIELLKGFKRIADFIFIGGGIANTFLFNKGINVGSSFKEEINLDSSLLKQKNIIIPFDVVILQRGKVKNIKVKDVNSLKGDFKILDIGKESVYFIVEAIKKAKMIVWNGPLGYFEKKPFDKGTKKIIQALLQSKSKVILGGGETIVCFNQVRNNLVKNLVKANPNIFISTGGGAMLEFLSGKRLCGVKALENPR